jgi:hypothetical protein
VKNTKIMPVSTEVTAKRQQNQLEIFFSYFFYRFYPTIYFYCKFFKESKTEEIENVRVVVRTRPQEPNGGKNVVTVDKNGKTITVQKPNSSNNEPAKVYGFDHVFDQDSSQVSTAAGATGFCCGI